MLVSILSRDSVTRGFCCIFGGVGGEGGSHTHTHKTNQISSATANEQLKIQFISFSGGANGSDRNFSAHAHNILIRLLPVREEQIRAKKIPFTSNYIYGTYTINLPNSLFSREKHEEHFYSVKIHQRSLVFEK